MKKLLTILVATGICTLAQTSWAQIVLSKPKAFTIAVGTQKSQKNTALRISIGDSVAKSGVCPYYVRSFEYLPSANLISIEVYQELCLNEAYGVSQGEAIWVAPKELQSKNSKITILVNQTPAGTLVYDHEARSFSIDGD